MKQIGHFFDVNGFHVLLQTSYTFAQSTAACSGKTARSRVQAFHWWQYKWFSCQVSSLGRFLRETSPQFRAVDRSFFMKSCWRRRLIWILLMWTFISNSNIFCPVQIECELDISFSNANFTDWESHISCQCFVDFCLSYCDFRFRFSKQNRW